ncbi:hypothetical protein Godav_010302 [Gossypium davidsonii]|uniref:Uncharacterized protein n=1 Tax=Gossypium davidsonii TaxID=34287 RepID=A0A7J8SGP4_GOSDV|nr:hypothetical protein [Gossypium davidsonii]
MHVDLLVIGSRNLGKFKRSFLFAFLILFFLPFAT